MIETTEIEYVSMATFAATLDKLCDCEAALAAVIEAEGISILSDAYPTRKAQYLADGRVWSIAFEAPTFTDFVARLGEAGVPRPCEHFGRQDDIARVAGPRLLAKVEAEARVVPEPPSAACDLHELKVAAAIANYGPHTAPLLGVADCTR